MSYSLTELDSGGWQVQNGSRIKLLLDTLDDLPAAIEMLRPKYVKIEATTKNEKVQMALSKGQALTLRQIIDKIDPNMSELDARGIKVALSILSRRGVLKRTKNKRGLYIYTLAPLKH